jgi:two-component system cell cycle sensor histidine kinase PleC
LKVSTRHRRAEGCVKVSVDDTLPLLKADQRSFTQVIINLVSNALKFTPEGKRIDVRALMRADGGITVQVADEGIGMAPEDIPKALAAFSQVDDNLSRRAEGSGLGLAIVRSIIEAHGGKLRIESEKGVGTTVYLEFPASKTLGRDANTAAA